MVTISLCMIVKNEEDVLERCLQSVAGLVDEINIVDTGSTDRTVEIAKKFTDRVFFYEWTGKFKDARNESFKYATKDYTFYMDADDVLLEADQKKFASLKASLDPATDSVTMFYQAVDEYDNVTIQYRRNRLLKTSRNFQWEGDCHNYIQVSGKILNADVAITHKKSSHAVGRNLSIYQSKIANGDMFTPRDYFYYANELRENGHYKEAIENYTKNLEQEDGWIEDKVYACIYRADCYRLTGSFEKELTSLFASFAFSKTPRAEACSRIGYHFQVKRDYHAAIYWYKMAASLEPDPDRMSFSFPAYYTWYPHLQLCVCYYNLQDFKQSYAHNEIARQYRPQDERILFNKNLLEKKLGYKEETSN